MLEKDNPCYDCGQCCESFVSTIGGVDVFTDAGKLLCEDIEWDDRTKRWMTDDVVRLTREEALATKIFTDEHINETYDDGRFKYSCKLYDKVEKVCTDHENRPQVCITFPVSHAHLDGFIKKCKARELLRAEVNPNAIKGTLMHKEEDIAYDVIDEITEGSPADLIQDLRGD